MQPSLPTPFFKEVEGFSLEADGHRLSFTVPEWMVPERRYCQVYVSVNGPHTFLIDIIHEEKFVQASPGRNAWQTALHNVLLFSASERQDIKTRRLERKWPMVRGSDYEIERLKTGMLRGGWEGREHRTFIQVTPEGFRIMLVGDRDFATFRPKRPPLQVCERGQQVITHLVGCGFNHGGAGRPSCSIDEKYPVQTQTGVKNMRKVDMTSNVEVPFDTSGTKIVKAVFDNTSNLDGKDYAYYAADTIKDLAVGDYAVVISPYGAIYDEASQGYVNIVQITSLEEDLEGVTKAAKWLVQKVDLSDYRDRLAKALRIRTLDARIETAKKEAMKRVELQRLMEASPELADLIKERLSLSVAADVAETEDAVVPSKA